MNYIIYQNIGILLIFFVIINSIVIPKSPCKNIFKYKYENNEWFGEIVTIVPNTGQASLRLNYTLNVNVPNNRIGKLDITADDEEITHNITRGYPVKYIFIFPLQSNLPLIKAITLNQHIICYNTYNDPDRRIKISLVFHSVWYTITNSANPTFPPVIPVTPHPQQITTKPIKKRPQSSTNRFGSNINDICGIIPNKWQPVHLIINGHRTSGAPWLVALFEYTANIFFCAGTLVTNQHIITAAHCIREKDSFLIKINVYDITKEYDRNLRIRTAKKYFVHPEYKIGKSHADIGIILLNEPIEFTDYIRPICLWPYSPNENLIYGRAASVVGWGGDNINKFTRFPKNATVQIIPTQQCSQKELLRNVLSEKTLCARGWQEIAGPCIGDSGGALSIFIKNRWFIRGVISTSIGDPSTGKCDVENYYSVYTDVAKHLNWIYTILQIK